MDLALSILPLVLVIATGWALVASNVLPKEQWQGIEVLSFRILIPALLLLAISRADLSLEKDGVFALILLASFVVMSLIALALRALVPQHALPNPAFTSVFQATTRWNGFIALAAADLIHGAEAVTLIAVAMAVLIAPINAVNITVLAIYGTAKASVTGVLRTIIRNPLVQASLAALALNLSGLAMPAPLEGALDLVAKAALGIGLLAVGAGIRLRRLLRPSFRVAAGVGLRLFVGPAVFLALAALAGLGPLQIQMGALGMAVPAAANGYIVARQMGGDAELYADILTWQTILSMALLPVLVAFLAVPTG
ncbi:MAG TPA: AEC family transporter [Aliiroseovarius sp.]|nr:AEC family transporter [Aliiroseovarius sp.]